MTVKFVVTGFSTFPGVPQNPTETAVRHLKQLLADGHIQLEGIHCLWLYNKYLLVSGTGTSARRITSLS